MIIITPRVTLCEKFMKDFKIFKNHKIIRYNETDSYVHQANNILVCQFESFYKFASYKFDIFLIDESTSLLKQIHSEFHKESKDSNISALKKILKTSSKVFLCDANFE